MTRRLVKEVERKEEQQETDQNIMNENQRAEREEEDLKEDMSEVNETDGFENIGSDDYLAEPQNEGGAVGEPTSVPNDRVGSDDCPAEPQNGRGAAGEPTSVPHDRIGSDDYPAEPQNEGAAAGEPTSVPHDKVGSDDCPAEPQNEGGAAGELTSVSYDKVGSDDCPAEPQNGRGAAGEPTSVPHDRIGSDDYPAESQNGRGAAEKPTPVHCDKVGSDDHPAEPQHGRGSALETAPAPHNRVGSGDNLVEPRHGRGTAGKPTLAYHDRIWSGEYPEEPLHGRGVAGKPTSGLHDRARNLLHVYATRQPPPPPPPVLIAVMGKTGTGKTSFINAITGGGGLMVGHGLESCTQDIQTARTAINGREVWLIDTPGFDDTNRSDVDILATIADWVQKSSSERNHLSGIIYFHRIVDPRMEGSNMKNLKMFRELCGEKNFNNVVLLTTMWDKVGEEEGQKREEELKSRAGFWGNLISRGAQVKRHRGPDFTASARNIAQPLIEKDTIVLKLQDELDRNGSLSDTSAGKFLTGEIEQVKRKHHEEVEALKAELKDTTNKEEIKLLMECYKEEIQALKKATDELEKLRAEDRRNFQHKMEEMQHRWNNRPRPGPCIIS